MPHLLAAVLIFAVGMLTVIAVWRADDQARRNRNCSRSNTPPPPGP